MSNDDQLTNDLGDALQADSQVVEIDLQALSDEFDEACHERHEMGEEKYGPNTWHEANTLAMMQDEIVDIANYARYSWIKLQMLRMTLDVVMGDVQQPLPGKEMLGKGSFLQTGRVSE
jgi:hypothetical protein